MKTSRLPYDLTLECRRVHRIHLLKAQLAWIFVGLASLVLCIAIGVLAGATTPFAGIFAGFVVLAGFKSAHYLLTRH
jgi:hypothetical protein